MKRDYTNFTTPYLPLDQYDAVEVAGCIEAYGCVERVEDDSEPHFWSVYLHLKEGGCECVADCNTRGQADEFAAVLEFVLRYVKEKS